MKPVIDLLASDGDLNHLAEKSGGRGKSATVDKAALARVVSDYSMLVRKLQRGEYTTPEDRKELRRNV